MKRKEVDDVLGGKEAWKNVDKAPSTFSSLDHWQSWCLADPSNFQLSEESKEEQTDTAATCPKCDHREGYYRQLQIRSADEPMTTF
jgi:DNA-directed RNA polymerase III subunit RPC11